MGKISEYNSRMIDKSLGDLRTALVDGITEMVDESTQIDTTFNYGMTINSVSVDEDADGKSTIEVNYSFTDDDGLIYSTNDELDKAPLDVLLALYNYFI